MPYIIPVSDPAMDLRALRCFLAVADELHFGRAALRLRMAQPALSQVIRRFERRLNVRLFERTTRRVALTGAGAVLVEQGRAILAAVDAAEEAVRRTHQGATETVRVGFTTLTPHCLLTRLAELHGRRRPGVRLAPEMLPGLRQIQQLKGDQLDAALLWLPPESAAGGMDRISYGSLARQRLVAVLPSWHRLASHRLLELAQLANDPFISYTRSFGRSVVREALDDACQAAGFAAQIIQEAPDATSLLWIISAGAGVSLMPECIRDMQVPGVVAIPLDGPSYELEFVVAWKTDDNRPILVDLLRSVAEIGGGIGVTVPESTGADDGRPQVATWTG